MTTLKKISLSVVLRACTASLAVSAGIHQAAAQSPNFDWNQTSNSPTDTKWSVGANWTPTAANGAPDGMGIFARISTNISANRDISLFNLGDAGDATKTVGRLDIGTMTGSGGFTLVAGTGLGVLNFNNGGYAAQLNQLSTSKNNFISAPVSLSSALHIDNASTSLLTISGTISGSPGITKTGVGTVILSSGFNTYLGGTTVNGGILQIQGSSLLNVSGTVTVNNGGTLLLSGAGNHIGDHLTLNLNGGTYHTNGLSETTGSLTLTSNSFLNLGAGASQTNFGGFDSGSGLLSVLNWNGNLIVGGGADQVLFETTSEASQALSQMRFVNPLGLPSGTYLGALAGPQLNEIVPGVLAPMIPEPATWAAGALAAATLAFAQRRRFLHP